MVVGCWSDRDDSEPRTNNQEPPTFIVQPPPPASVPTTTRLTALTFLLSSAILAYEIALMRILLVASWYHFASVLISLALLGFGWGLIVGASLLAGAHRLRRQT